MSILLAVYLLMINHHVPFGNLTLCAGGDPGIRTYPLRADPPTFW